MKFILSCALEASSMFQCQKSAAIAPFCFDQVKGKKKNVFTTTEVLFDHLLL